jgi:hypothetical protein
MKTTIAVKDLARRVVALALCEALVILPLSGGQSAAPPAPVQTESLRGYLQKSYLELFELAPTLKFSADEIGNQRKAFEKGEESCVNRFKGHVERYQKQIDKARSELKKKTAKMSGEQRKQAHCSIQNLDLLKSEAEILARHAIPTAYDNLSAKLDVIEKWPALYKQTQQEIASEAYLKRRWSDVKDNGVSWFRTHPAFYQRMVETQREILFLPHKSDFIMQTSAFEEMKQKLAPITAKADTEEVKKPSLLMTREEGCEPPKKLEYKPGQPIEELCAVGAQSPRF